MQKIFKSILSFCLAVAVCVSTAAVLGVTQHSVADAATVDTYYSKITASGGTQLLGQLHDLIVETHKTYTSYDDCKKYGPTTDPALDGTSGAVMEFYTHETIKKFVGGVGDWNREHVWCQSLSNGLWGQGGGGSDLHHIRPSESGLNSTRGNCKYGYAKDTGKEAWSRDNSKNDSKLGGWYIGTSIFEPLDNVKGDAARIVMYVYTHYNNASNVGGTKESAKTHGNLNFTNVISASNEAAAIKMLLEWNKLDPVDEIELYRNEAVYKIQGNRNPFIDNSSYADAIWGGGTVVDPPTPGPGPTPGPSDTLQSIRLNATSLNLAINDTYNLTVTPTPSNASASATWSTSDSSVATVSNGKITAKAAGTATITATSTANTSIKATATVTVRQTSSSTVTSGKTIINRDSFTNASSGYAFQTWKAKSGVEGTAFIYGGKEESMQFNIKQKSHYLASTTTLGTIKSITVKAAAGNSEDRPWQLLTSTTAYGTMENSNPSDGKDRGTKTVTESGVTWSIDGNDTYFALIYALDATSGAAYLDSIEVEYASGGSSGDTDKLEELLINPSEFELQAGDSTKLTVSAIPSTASAAVTWTSSNPSVATVSEDGTVTAHKAGTATITATSTVNSAITATATVTVTEEAFVSGSTNATAFHNAVAAINDGTLAEWHATISAAVKAYKALSASDKTEVSSDVEKLNSAISNYNDTVKAYNGAADDADKPALSGASRLI